MALLCHPWFTTTNLSYRFPISETSATALCGTTGTSVPKGTRKEPLLQFFVKNQNSHSIRSIMLIVVFQMAEEEETVTSILQEEAKCPPPQNKNVNASVPTMFEGSLEVKLPTYGRMKPQWWEEPEKRKSQRDPSEKRAPGESWSARVKAEKSRSNVFFQCFEAAEGRKVGSLKRRVPSHLIGWEIKNCKPLWR